MATTTPIFSAPVRGVDRFAIRGRGDAIIVSVEAPYMAFLRSLFQLRSQLVLRSGHKTLCVERFELVHVSNPDEAFGSFGLMAKDAPEWLAPGVEVLVFERGSEAD